MKRRNTAYFLCIGLITLWSCGHTETTKTVAVSENRIVQQEDGQVSMKIEKAGLYCDQTNPSLNTADWNVVISKPGRFGVWLSSATKDTSDLKYLNSVRISLLDNRLEGKPACDKIVHNPGDASFPFYRADSYMGSVYVAEPGEYNVQVISEKVSGNQAGTPTSHQKDDTQLVSVMLTPLTR